MAEGPKKFGRYFLLDLVAQGGMAEIYRARLGSSEGAGRLLVIKRIQPSYGNNSEFLAMFKSEIKVTMGFNHPNIVQLYDFGEENQQPYIAMEFVDGRNVRQFMTRFLDLKQRFPIELAVYIIEQSACGLHYAHSFRDKITGQALNVVHRDISPQNLLISYEGTVKVIDFGIAKATTNVEATRVGVIKGKPSYLSPEQINGDVLDGRADIFSLGTVLWELLTGRKLFQGENDLAILKLIESCQTHVKPPSTLNPNVAPELDYIVLKALAKHREKRYQTAEEFQRALHRYLYSFMPDFNPSDLSYYAKDLFKKEIVEDRLKIQRLNGEVEKLLSVPEPPPLEPMTSLGLTDHIMAPELEIDRSASMRSESTEERPGGSPPLPSAPTGRPISVRSASSSFTMIDSPKDMESVVEIERTIASPTRARPSGTQSTGTSRPVDMRGSRSTRQTQTGNTRRQAAERARSRQLGSTTRRGPLVAAAALIVVALFGKDLGIPIPILTDVPELLESLVGGGTRLVLQGDEKSARVLVNDKVVANRLPATVQGEDLPVGAPFKLVVQGSDDRTFEAEISLKRGEKQQLPVTLSRRPPQVPGTFPTQAPQQQAQNVAHGTRTILLHLNILPGGPGTSVMLDGNRINVSNPVVQVDLDKDLDLSAERKGYRPFRKIFVISSREVAGLSEMVIPVPLAPLHYGYVNLKSTPSADAIFTVDGQVENEKTPLRDLMLPIGTYSFRLVNKVLGMEKTVSISLQQDGQVVTLDVPLDMN